MNLKKVCLVLALVLVAVGMVFAQNRAPFVGTETPVANYPQNTRYKIGDIGPHGGRIFFSGGLGPALVYEYLEELPGTYTYAEATSDDGFFFNGVYWSVMDLQQAIDIRFQIDRLYSAGIRSPFRDTLGGISPGYWTNQSCTATGQRYTLANFGDMRNSVHAFYIDPDDLILNHIYYSLKSVRRKIILTCVVVGGVIY
jgi:hypothetical protein